MTLQRFLHEPERGVFVSGFGDVALEDLALVIDRSPEVDHLAVELHVHLIEMPSPVPEAAHRRHALPADVASEHGAEPVPPHSDGLVADVDAVLEQQVPDIPQRQRKPHVHHHDRADHLR